MRQILNLETNKVEIVEDQVATDAIAAGKAVPSIDPITVTEKKSVTKAPETAVQPQDIEVSAQDQAPEVK